MFYRWLPGELSDTTLDQGFGYRPAKSETLKSDPDFGVFSAGFAFGPDYSLCNDVLETAPEERILYEEWRETPWQDSQRALAQNLGPRYTCGYLAFELYGWRLLHVAPASEGGEPIAWEYLIGRDQDKYYETLEPLSPSQVQSHVEQWLDKHGWRLACATYDEEGRYADSS